MQTEHGTPPEVPDTSDENAEESAPEEEEPDYTCGVAIFANRDDSSIEMMPIGPNCARVATPNDLVMLISSAVIHMITNIGSAKVVGGMMNAAMEATNKKKIVNPNFGIRVKK